MQIGVETSRSVENKRVFVVDYDEATRAALQFILIDENETHEVASLDKAFELGEGRKVDLVLLGSAIAEESGMGAFAELAARLPGAKILVVVQPGEKDFGQLCVNAGADGILPKPFSVESVRKRVDNVLGRQTAGGMIPLAALTKPR